MFIMLDGIDGSGKSTVIKMWKEHLAASGNAIFDLTAYWSQFHRYPDFAELKPYDFIFSAEPTGVGIGQVIREELIKNGSRYPARAIAEAYALDRLILYTKIILPALKDGKCVIQDRGISSSLAYQPAADKKLTAKMVSSLVGNQLALKYAPNHLVLIDISPKVALKRIAKRTGKQDNVIFEKLTFLTKLAKIYRSAAFQNLFKQHHTTIHYLPAEENIAIIKEKAIALLQKILKS